MRHLSFVLLFACGSSIALPNEPSKPQTVTPEPEDEGQAPVEPPPEAPAPPRQITVRLRGTSAAGLLVTLADEPPIYVAPGADVSFSAYAGSSLDMAAATAGSRVVFSPCTACTVSTATTYTVVLEDILYVRRTSQVDNVFAMAFDGSNVRQLTHFSKPGLAISHLRISPDGESIVYVSNRAVGGSDAIGLIDNVWLAPAHDVSAAKVLAAGAQPSWAPDSRSVLLSNGGQMARVDVATGVSVPLGEGAAPALSPDGKALAYVKGGVLWIDSHAASDIPASVKDGPIWNASGTKLLFGACDNVPCTARSAATVNADGSDGTRYTTVNGYPAMGARGDTFYALTGGALLSIVDVVLLGGELPVAVSFGRAGSLLLTETADAYHLQGVGFELDLAYAVGTIHDLTLTP